MKKLILVITLSVFSLFAFAENNEGIQFEDGSWKEITTKAKKEKKLIFIDCYTSWCGPCKKLAATIFPLKNVGDFFNKNFISYKLDMEKGEGPELNKNFHVGAYPTLLWVDHKGNLVHRVVGFMKEDKLLAEANNAINGGNYNQYFEKQYNKNRNKPEIVKAYLDYLLQTADARAISVAKQYLSIIPEEEYTSAYVFNLLSKNTNSPCCNAFDYVIDNRDLFNEKFGKGAVDVMFTNVFDKYARTLSNEVKYGKEFDQLAYNKLLEYMDRTNYESKDELAQEILVKVLENKKDWKAYAKKINSLIENKVYKNLNHRQLTNWYEAILKSDCKDNEVLESTINWIDKAIECNEIFQMQYIKKDWEAKVEILERMDGKSKLLEQTKTELRLLNKLEIKQEEAKKRDDERKKMFEELLKGQSNK